MRVRRFHLGQTYCSEVLTSIGDTNEVSSANTVIFDGGLAFLRNKDLAPHNNVVVMLDRAGIAFSEAAATLNEAYVKHGAHDECLEWLRPETVGWGVEVLMYTEKVQ
jgi:hypothetical protein